MANNNTITQKVPNSSFAENRISDIIEYSEEIKKELSEYLKELYIKSLKDLEESLNSSYNNFGKSGSEYMDNLLNSFPCPVSKKDILQKISDNNSSSHGIQKAIKKIQKEVENSSCNTRKLSEKQAEELEKIAVLFEKYKKEEYTKNTKQMIETLFNSIPLNLKKLDILLASLEKTMDLDKDNLEDTIFITGILSYRDNVEKNISFIGEYLHGTYGETPEMNIFLNLFTIKYIDFLRDNKKVAKKRSKLLLNKNELLEILLKVKNIIKGNSLNFKVEFTLESSVEKIDLSKL